MDIDRCRIAIGMLFILALSLLVAPHVAATTWVESEIDDPFSDAKCIVSEPASYGSYIYQWPSKLDGVYWPHTTMRWVWHCPTSGYTSFGDDFDALSDAERADIGAFLSGVGLEALPHGELKKLLLLDAIYSLRDKDAQFRSWLLRVKANLYESLADDSRRSALPHLEQAAASDIHDFAKLQSTFVLGHYLLKYGETERAKGLLGALATMEWTDDDGSAQVGSAYINGLVAELEAQFEIELR